MAEDAVRDACTAALAEWRVDGIPSYPLGWLVGVARHKAIDALRREGRRAERETAAIAACHSCTDTPGRTDWRKIAVLYGDLMRYEPTVVFEANRAVAVATSEGPAAGLVILDAVAHHPQLARWPHLHLARADLLRRLGRHEEAIDAYRNALQLEPSGPEQAFIQKRLRDLDAR